MTASTLDELPDRPARLEPTGFPAMGLSLDAEAGRHGQTDFAPRTSAFMDKEVHGDHLHGLRVPWVPPRARCRRGWAQVITPPRLTTACTRRPIIMPLINVGRDAVDAGR